MARKKSNNKSGNGKKGFRLPWPVRFIRFLLSSPMRYILLAVIIIGVIIWQWAAIIAWISAVVAAFVAWVNAVVTGALRTFGWGLLFIFAAIGILIWMVRQRKFSSLIYQWNRWLGGVILALFVWGALGFIPVGSGIFGSYSLGGKVGRGIIGYTDLEGGVRLLVLLVAGIILMVPGASFRFIKNTGAKMVKQFKQPGYKEMPQPQIPPPVPVPPSLREPPEPSATAVSEEKTTPVRRRPAPAVTPASTPQELKQVAQEVWKKYGESPSVVTVDGWKLPPIDILDNSPEVVFSQADNAERARLIEDALASYGVDAKVVQINAGPTVTQFGVEPGWDRKTKEVKERDRDGNIQVRTEEISKTRVKVDRITSLANDLALALAAPSIRIEAPVPGKSIVGIEVPNTISTMVSLRGVIETSVFQKMQMRARLALALGKGAGGEAVAADLAKMPHLLIAGATGSGKTVCLDAIVCCLVMNNTPNDVRFIMIDPKRVELTTFNSIPHLASPVIVDAEKAVRALHGLSEEMNSRYQLLASAGARNIENYNKNKEGADKMPYLVLIIDELADLMMLGGDEVEQTLCRLAQLSRAVGIHLVVATQRPSVDVVTGLIKANFPTRISFAVSSQVDSRTILDSAGAEKLLGSGDMLYMPTEAGKPKRLQGCYVSDAEAERLVYFWGSQKPEKQPVQLKLEELASSSGAAGRGGHPQDSLLEAARQLADEHDGHISTSFLQRRLHIGYPRAARLMEQLQEEWGGEEMTEEEEEEQEGGEE